ncbi:MAG: EAL domain-containing protein, partial [Acidobacteriota bacterium]|nr:EAL domain-containing protein [Acidobacteriota bacterium]
VTASIGEAPDGSVLVGQPQGLFRLRSDRFEPVAMPGNKPGIWSYTGIVHSGSRTWIATDAGLMAVTARPDGSLAVESGPQPPAKDLTRAQSIFADRGLAGDVVWWGCGYSLCRSKDGAVTVLGAGAGLQPDAAVNSIVRDREGNLWIVQKRKLAVMRPGSSRFESPETPLPVTGPGSPQLDSDGRLLVPTTEGLAIRDESGFRIEGRAAGVLPPVYSVLQDREGSVWLGLAGRGLAKWQGYGHWESFTAQSGLTGETVYEILPRPDGAIWAGTETGLFRGERNPAGQWSWRAVKSVGAIPVHAVQAAPDGKLWLGSDSNGVGRFDPASERVQWYTAANGLLGQNVWAVLVDRSGTVWAGSDKGLFRLAPGETRFRGVGETNSADPLVIRVFALTEAPNGDVWAGTAAGIWRYAEGRWTRFSQADGLKEKAVIALAAGKNNELWIGYRLSGTISLLDFRGGGPQFRHFDPPTGQPINITYFLGFDAAGRLWAGTNLGVLMRTDSGRWDQYDHHDGLIWDDCDLHAFAAEPDGHVWIGTSGGLSHFLVRASPARSEPPRTVFTSLVGGKSELEPNRQAVLAYADNSIVARFTALRFGRERDILFRYRLTPLFQTWRETPDRELQFPAIPPGRYRLEVEARDTLSDWSMVPAAFEFRIRAPWWRQWWFLGGSGFAVVLLGSLMLRSRNARQQAIRRALEQAVAERTLELSHQYRHDVLTGLPNRLLFGERLHRELLAAERNKARVAVLFIDLDRFKRINDTWGHRTGDQFLKQIAERLRSGLRAGETIARIGGDEFIVLIPGLQERAEAESRGWELIRTLEPPVRMEGRNVFATMSVGIGTFPDDALEAGALMAAADAAMYRAKAAGKNQVQLFKAGMTEAASRPQNIEDRLREAIAGNKFRLWYQPQYTLEGKLAGFEALLRIEGMERELGPGEFIPIAEESGLIVEIGAWAFREALNQMKTWQGLACPAVRVAVNVSVTHLARSGFEDFLFQTIAETGVDPGLLELELTETALVKDTGDSAGLLNRIRERGIQVALDDFGTGFSPMQYLHQLPVDIVKIDRVFIKDLDGQPSSMPLVEGMVKLARTL